MPVLDRRKSPEDELQRRVINILALIALALLGTFMMVLMATGKIVESFLTSLGTIIGALTAFLTNPRNTVVGQIRADSATVNTGQQPDGEQERRGGGAGGGEIQVTGDEPQGKARKGKEPRGKGDEP